MQNLIEEINHFIASRNLWEWEITAYENNNLKISGSFDLGYYHQIELLFGNAAYIACPTNWDWPTGGHMHIELVDALDIVRKTYGEADEDDRLFLLHANAEQPFKIVAQALFATYLV